jgi:hypothetical protein
MKLKKVSGHWMIDDHTGSGGVKTVAAWERIVASLRADGMFRPTEDVVGIEADHMGVTFTLENKT